jgi:ribosomal RNA small subunit methyltransferase A
LSLLEEAKIILAGHGIRPKRGFGQNFCIDSSLLERLVTYSNIGKDDVVLEIGAGLGFLTSKLAANAKQVLAVEADPSLIPILEERFAKQNVVRVIQGDILNLPHFNFDKIVANPPYNISSKLLTTILGWDFKSVVLTLQVEFGEKLIAQAGEESYGILSVLAQYKNRIELLDHVSRSSFYPPPRVESAIVRISPHSPSFQLSDNEVFEKLVRSLFTQRRKKVRNSLEHFLRSNTGTKNNEMQAIVQNLPGLDRRVIDLEASAFATLSNTITKLFRGKRIEYGALVFYVFPEVYQPSDDTFLLAQNLEVHPGLRVVDVGSGCGILGIIAASKGCNVTAVDINPFAIDCSSLNAKLNGVSNRYEAKLGDLFQDLNGEQFDLMVFNPPYLPQSDEEETGGWLEKAWQGGSSGKEVIDRFLKDASSHLITGGEIRMVLSSLSHPESTIQDLEARGFEVTLLAKEKLDFEELTVLKARKSALS